MTLRLVSTLAENVDEMAQHLARHLTDRGIPCQVDDTRDVSSADLLWMCGLLAAQSMSDKTIQATPSFAPEFAKESGPSYRTLLVTRSDQPATLDDLFARGTWALNEPSSWSGHYSLISHTRSLKLNDVSAPQIRWSGSHIQSLDLVAKGEVDVAPIDSSVWAWAAHRFPNVEVVGETRRWPAPPILVSDNARGQLSALAYALAGWSAPGLAAVHEVQPDHCDPIWSEFRSL